MAILVTGGAGYIGSVTAVRDYIHVADRGQAHLKALQHLRDSGGSERSTSATALATRYLR